MRLRAFTFALAVASVALGCNTGPSEPPTGRPDPKPAPAPSPSPPPPQGEGVLRLGTPIEGEAAARTTSLADVAKNPAAFVGKTFTTTGTVTAVCQHMGCWMEIKDDAGEAHVKMAGHAFFVPKTAAGRKARVMATLVKGDDDPACAEGEGKMGALGGSEKKAGCRAEAEQQLGHPLAKLELVAQGVELL